MSASNQLASFNYAVQPQGGSSSYFFNIQTSSYTILPSDAAKIVRFTTSAGGTCYLPPASTFAVGFNVWIWNDKTVGFVTITPSGSDTVSGLSTYNVYRGQGIQLINDGTNWKINSWRVTQGFAFCNNNSPTTIATATGIASVAIGYGASATGGYTTAIGANGGGTGSAAGTGFAAMALGGSYASGACSFAAAGGTNSSSYGAQGGNSVAMGYHAKSATCYGQAYGYGTSAAGTSAVAIGKCATATGTGTLSFGISTTATPNYSTAIGNNGGGTGSVTATNVGAMALGGSYASGVCSFAAAIGNNTSTYGATGGYYPIAIGYHAKAQCTYAIAIGAASTAFACAAIAIGLNANGGPAGVAIGRCAYNHLNCAIAIGNHATSQTVRSVAIGYYATSLVRGKYAYSAYYAVSGGDSQTGTTILVATTTNATATVMTTNNIGAGTDTLVNLPNNTAYAFTGIVVARQQAAGGTASAAWSVSGLIRREGTASTTTLVSSAINTISNVPSWTLALSADTTNGALAVTFTGAASTNIYCVATIQTSECTYA